VGIFFWLGRRERGREKERGDTQEGLILLRRFLNGWKGGTWMRFLLALASPWPMNIRHVDMRNIKSSCDTLVNRY
jgi:hypothetical protein